MEARVCQHIHLAVEQCLEILTEADEIQERAVRVHFHEEVNVAPRTGLAARDRAKQAHVVRAVARRDVENLLAPVLQIHGPARPYSTGICGRFRCRRHNQPACLNATASLYT